MTPSAGSAASPEPNASTGAQQPDKESKAEVWKRFRSRTNNGRECCHKDLFTFVNLLGFAITGWPVDSEDLLEPGCKTQPSAGDPNALTIISGSLRQIGSFKVRPAKLLVARLADDPSFLQLRKVDGEGRESDAGLARGQAHPDGTNMAATSKAPVLARDLLSGPSKQRRHKPSSTAAAIDAVLANGSKRKRTRHVSTATSGTRGGGTEEEEEFSESEEDDFSDSGSDRHGESVSKKQRQAAKTGAASGAGTSKGKAKVGQRRRRRSTSSIPEVTHCKNSQLPVAEH